MTCFRVISSMLIPAQIAKSLNSFLAIGAVRNKYVMVPFAFFSQHQHLDTILIFILCRLSYVAILLFQPFYRKKFILKGIPFTQMLLFSSMFSYFCLTRFQVDLTLKLPCDFPIHRGRSLPCRFDGVVIFSIICKVISL